MEHVDLRSKNITKVKSQLTELLVTSRKGSKLNRTIDDYLVANHSRKVFPRLRSPLGLLRYIGVKKNAPLWFVANLIERQFQIKWATRTGEPEEFNYYDVCGVDKSKAKMERRYLEYGPLNAYIKVQLYRYCKGNHIKDYTKTDLCPLVYFKTIEDNAKEWRVWNTSEGTFSKLPSPFNDHFQWIRKPVRDYIFKNASPVECSRESMTKALRKHSLYWVIVQNTDFKSCDVNLSDVGKTLVYVGKASKGIEERWIKDSKSHCSLMIKCLNNVLSMPRYQPEILKGIQLVQARLLLAKLRNENNEIKEEKPALFLVKTYDGKEAEKDLKCEEKFHINGKNIYGKNIINNVPWKPKDMAYGMNGR